MADLEGVAQAILNGDPEKTEELVKSLLKDGVPARDILKKGLIAGIEEVGVQFGNGEIFLPELMMAGEAMKITLPLLKSILTETEGSVPYVGKVAIGSVEGDIHDIGKNIMLMMLEGNGWEVTDLGIDVSPEGFCKAVRENDFQVLGLSALLTSTMPAQKEAIDALKAAGLRDKVKVAIGGSVCTQEWCDEIGADCFATDAAEGVKKLRLLLPN
jgi:5-methyltetrahydrofolate--homocysteine methyltransferase